MTTARVWTPSRRAVVTCAAAIGAAGCATPRAPRGEPGVVNTSAGKVRGATEQGVHVFKGVPYGATTAPPHRFRAPRPAAPWTGVRDALAYGPYAPQGASTARLSPSPAFPANTPDSAPRRLLANNPVGERAGEDCLVLNVWTPALGSGKRPVLVWLHGGGFTSGSGASTWYEGVNLARKQDVVVVTINHRLNVLGYLHLASLAGGAYADASSVGMLDCVLALRWVRENIDRFGGDPSRVLIFGESGGARKTSTLMAMPEAKGLFHRCVVQSGSQLTLDTPDIAMERTERLLKALAISPADAAKLQEVSLDRLLAAAIPTMREAGQFRPVAGAPSTPRHPFHPDASPVNPDVPMMIGSNRTEQSVFLGGDPAIANLDEAGLMRRLAAWLPEHERASVLGFYRELHPRSRNDELLYMIGTDRGYFLDSTIQAELKAAQGQAPAYYYQFYRTTPVEGGRYHTPHASEIPFVFDNLDKAVSMGGQPTAASQALADAMSTAWCAFARTGDPNHSGLPQWPRYDGVSRPAMIFDEHSRIENDPRSAQRKRMLAIGSQQLTGGREPGALP